MRIGNGRAVLIAAMGMLAANAVQPAVAADSYPEQTSIPSEMFLYELRLGVFAHDPGGSPLQDGGADINVEALFGKPIGDQSQWWWPRPHIGATIATGGGTSVGYAGATWQYDFTRSVFVEATFGGSVNNQDSDDRKRPGGLGCTLLFRESASIGYRFDRSWSLLATVEHHSNAGLCDENRGLTNVGARIGYRF